MDGIAHLKTPAQYAAEYAALEKRIEMLEKKFKLIMDHHNEHGQTTDEK